VSSKARSKDLSPRQRQVLAALTNEFSGPDSIAQRAAIRTTHPRATAAKYCAEFVRLGLAEKSGTRWSPKWRRTQKGARTGADD
jgi:DNA-binding IclR family transcriptional regulator